MNGSLGELEDQPAPGRPAASRCRRATRAGRRRTGGSCGGGTRGRRWRTRSPRGAGRGVGAARGSSGRGRRARRVAGCSWVGSRPASRSSRWPARWARRSSASAIIASRRSILRRSDADLAVDRVEGVGEDRAALGGVVRSSGSGARLRARACLVLEQLADLREREPGVVAQAADEPQALEVLGVVQAVGALGAGGGGEQPQLLVVADRARRQAGVGGDLLDAEEALWAGGGGGGDGVGHPSSLRNLTVHVKVRDRGRRR